MMNNINEIIAIHTISSPAAQSSRVGVSASIDDTSSVTQSSSISSVTPPSEWQNSGLNIPTNSASTKKTTLKTPKTASTRTNHVAGIFYKI